MLNLDYIRSQFPGLNTDWILLDNAGGSQILKPVVDRLNDHFYTSNVQLGGSYPHSVLAEERHAKAHTDLMEWINASHPSEIIMGSSTSLLIKTLSDNFRRVWKPGDEIIVTNCDHEANIGAWRHLADYGIVVREWRINPDTFELEKEELKKLLNEKTKLVAFTAASNVLGTLNPVKEFTKIIHDAGALVCVDAVAYAPHRRIDVKDTGVDFFVFSFYKTYGPHYAMMYGKKEILDSLPGNNHFFINDSPYKFQPGNYNFEFCYAMGALPEYLLKLADLNGYPGDQSKNDKFNFIYSQIAEHEETLAMPVIDFLKSKKGVRIIGSSSYSREIRVPTISFVKEKTDSISITQKSDIQKVAIRWGDFYARRLIDDHGFAKQNGVVRVSMVHYNTAEEAEKLIKTLDSIL
jgi:cysteine desulfurase family protein (TIGR01976 family)